MELTILNLDKKHLKRFVLLCRYDIFGLDLVKTKKNFVDPKVQLHFSLFILCKTTKFCKK